MDTIDTNRMSVTLSDIAESGDGIEQVIARIDNECKEASVSKFKEIIGYGK